MVVGVADADVPCQALGLPWSTIAVRVRAYIVTVQARVLRLLFQLNLDWG